MGHHSSCGILPHLAVEYGTDARIPRIKLRFDPWANRAEGIESLAARPLAVAFLDIPRGYIIEAGIAEDIFCSMAGFYCMRLLADHYAQLGFIIHALAQRRVNDIIAIAHNAGVRLQEQQRFLRLPFLHFIRMRLVIFADANDLCGFSRRKKLHIFDGILPPIPFDAIIRRSSQPFHGILFQNRIKHFVLMLCPNNTHSFLLCIF